MSVVKEVCQDLLVIGGLKTLDKYASKSLPILLEDTIF